MIRPGGGVKFQDQQSASAVSAELLEWMMSWGKFLFRQKGVFIYCAYNVMQISKVSFFSPITKRDRGYFRR